VDNSQFLFKEPLEMLHGVFHGGGRAAPPTHAAADAVGNADCTWRACDSMKTLSLVEAAAFLRLHPEELRRRAKLGKAPGAKIGKCWVFLDVDLAEYVRSFYASPRQALRVTPRKEVIACHSTNADRCGGFDSPHRQESALDALLKQPTKRSRKNCTTS